MTSAEHHDGIASMTGFGSAEADTKLGRVQAEIRSVNFRFFDFNVRSPREWNSIEIKLRDLVKTRVRRGKVDLFLRWEPAAELTPKLRINGELFKQYSRDIQSLLAQVFDQKSPLPLEFLMNYPGVTTNVAASQATDEAIWSAVAPVTHEALERMARMRIDEGRALADDLRMHLSEMRSHAEHIDARKDDAVSHHRDRLTKRIEEIRAKHDVPLDEARLETEMLFYAERSDVAEELVRLRAHLDKMQSLLDGDGGIGRDLDFLVQELLRETNTIGSKARETDMINSVLQMKAIIERVREQAQNLE